MASTSHTASDIGLCPTLRQQRLPLSKTNLTVSGNIEAAGFHVPAASKTAETPR
jgi:hypothetical protein